MVSRSMSIRILQLPGTMRVTLASGCTSQAPGCPNCTACLRQYTAQDVGRQDVLPIGSADIQVQMLYEPPATPAVARRSQPRASDFSVELVVVHAASGTLILILALGLFLALPCCLYLSFRHARYHCHQYSAMHFIRHLRPYSTRGNPVSSWSPPPHG